MEKEAHARFVRISARKARTVIDVIRGKNVEDAMDLLKFIPRAGARPIEKVLKCAVANARTQDSSLDERSLTVARCWIDQGPAIGRWRPRAYGRASKIRKGTSHISIVVSDEV